MKKLTICIVFLLTLNCADQATDEIDCKLFDPAFPSLYVKFVDINGNNLIENGIIDPDEIILEKGLGFRFIPPNEFAVPDAGIRVFDNTLNLGIPNESTFEYSIQLNEMNTVKLDFSAELTRIP